MPDNGISYEELLREIAKGIDIEEVRKELEEEEEVPDVTKS